MPAVRRLRKIVIPDLPGCGQTPPLATPTVSAYATWLHGFAERLGLASVELGGLCLGATLALEYTSRWPDQVGALLLHTPICSARMVRTWFKAQVATFTSGPFFALAERLRRNRTVSDLYKRWVVEGPDVDPEDARINFENQVRAHAPSAREWLRDALRRDYEAMLSRWPKPALMLAAQDDRILELGRLRRLAASMPRATVTVIPQAGHGWNRAFIAAQVRAVCDFLDSVRP